jgi:flagellar hook-length control protein FliK
MRLAKSSTMNTAPVIQTSVQPSVGPSSTAAGADNTAKAGGAQSPFAGALNAAGAKPGRRSGASKQSEHGSSGGSLPPAGNQLPPVPQLQTAAAAVATPPAGVSSAADHPRVERGRASGPALAENPLAIQAAGAAALIEGAKSLLGATTAGPAGAAGAAANATAGAATKAATFGATKNAATLDTVGGQPAMKAGIESGLAAKSPATAVEASAVVAANAAVAVNAAAASKPKAPAPIASLQSNPALTPDSATTADAAKTPDLAKTPDAATIPGAATTTVDLSAGIASAPAASASASAASDKAAAKPHPAALRPVSQALGRTAAPATGSATAPADGGGANSTLSTPSSSSGDTSTASGAAQAPVPAIMGAAQAPVPAIMATGAQDSAAMTAAAAAAVAGTPRLANTGKPSGDNSYDSDASVAALGAGAEAAASAASAPPGRSGMGAAAGPVVAPNAATAPTLADAAKPAHGGFDLAALTGSPSDAAAGLSQLNANASVGAPADATPAAALRIHASVDSADFTQGLSDRVSWMVDNGVNGAKLQVNPPQLGPIELRISVQGDHAQVWMTTHSAVARDALEASSPKLREMLNAQGFGQVSVDISQRSFQDRSAFTPPYQRESAGVRSAAVTSAAPTTTASAPRSLLGALDAYA